MALPEPAFSFTIPSVHDDTVLDCRVYHPVTFFSDNEGENRRWEAKGAILAHPYAPMGGCQDDPVVCALAKAILTKGMVVGTFNFRYDPRNARVFRWRGAKTPIEEPGVLVCPRAGRAGRRRRSWRTTLLLSASSSNIYSILRPCRQNQLYLMQMRCRRTICSRPFRPLPCWPLLPSIGVRER